MSSKILFVDDDVAVLDSFRRLLGREVEMETAVGGASGLDIIANSGPFAVVISDMRMPEMDGAHFLGKVREIAPSAVRMVLTGHADIATAMEAVNSGHIFRFLTKPCAKGTLLSAIEDALGQHRLILAEKEVLEGTLRGCVDVLAEMLSFSNPAAFGRATRLRHFVRHAAKKLNLEAAWSFEIAAMLSQLGCLTLSAELVNSAYVGQTLSPEDQKKYDSQPAVAARMLRKIPRFEQIADMIANQNTPLELPAGPGVTSKGEAAFGSHLLRVGLAYDVLITQGVSAEEARRRVRASSKRADLALVALLDDFELQVPMRACECRVSELMVGAILQQEVRVDTGLLIAAKGQELSIAWIERLKEYWRRGEIPGRLLVQIPGVAE